MEVIHSTNIVFNSQGKNGRESNDEIETFKMSKPFRKMKSPQGSKLPKPSKSPWDGLNAITPIKGHPIDSPTKFSALAVLPPTPAFESPKLNDSPLKEMESSACGMYDLPSPVKDRKRISPADSGSNIGLPKVFTLDSPLSVSPSKINPKDFDVDIFLINMMEDPEYPRVLSPLTKGPITQFVLEGKQVKTPDIPDIRAMYNGSRRDIEETSDFTMNPDPVPYQPSNFMPHRFDKLDIPDPMLSSTVLKKVPVQRRHIDSFDLASSPSKRGVILHTDRYQWDLARALDGMSQRERLQAELEYMERLRGIKRRSEVLPHRAQLDLLMGGKKVEFTERFEIQREIQKLRSLILPQNARDLFHGRGFRLPEEHNSVHPRRPLPPDIDNEELQDGHGQPVILSKEKRTVASLKARLHIPTRSTQPAYLQRAKTNFVPVKHGTRPSFTAIPDHKTKERPLAKTAPVVKNVPKDIKIPVSSREDTDMLLDSQPKPPPPTANKKPELEEDIVIQEISDEKDARRVVSPQSTHQQATASPTKAPTPNPLKGSELPGALSEEEQNKLKQTFRKLDTDMDGHLLYSQLQSQLPKQFSQTQEKFIKLVYDITSSCTFFGVDEFMTMSYLTNTVTSLSGPVLQAYDTIDFYTLREVILKYVELFQSVDRSHKGKISLSSLQDILSAALVIDLKADPQRWAHITDLIAPSETGQITKIEFLAHIPYFQTLVHK